jgi:hypothetical protein
MLLCTFAYAGVQVYDGDGVGFDIRLDVAAGLAYAVELSLAAGSPAAAHLIFYYATAAGGAAGFEPVFGAPLGDWPATPPGHTSYPQYLGCAAAERACWGPSVGELRSEFFEMHPEGGTFSRRLAATWVAPVAGPVLLRIALHCAVPFFADIEVDGCQVEGDGSYECTNHDNGNCASELVLTITADSFVGPDGVVVAGQAVRNATIEVQASELAALAVEMMLQAPTNGLASNSPTLADMLVPGSTAAALLASIFATDQQAHIVYPAAIDHAVEAVASGSSGGVSLTNGAGKGGGHRRIMQGDADGAVGIRVELRARSAVSEEAEEALGGLITEYSADNELLTQACSAFTESSECGIFTASQCLDSVPSEIEALVAEVFTLQPAAQRTLRTPPAVEQMLVPGSQAQALLAKVFVRQQAWHRTSLAAVELLGDGLGGAIAGSGGKGVGGHRRVQEGVGGGIVRLTLQAEAPTPQDADGALAELLGALGLP